MNKPYVKLSGVPAIQHVKSALDHTTIEILKIVSFATALAALSNAVIHGIKLRAILALPVLFVLSAGLMFVFSRILRRRSRSTALLEEAFVKAWRKALDQSSLNPHLNKRNEQTTRKASTES